MRRLPRNCPPEYSSEDCIVSDSLIPINMVIGSVYTLKPLRILIVDDSQTARRMLRAILWSRQWTVCEAEDGMSGVQKFEELKPDAVVLDLAMPDIDGVEAAKRMAAVNPEVPLILFTVLEIQGLEKPAQEAGISAVVPKNHAWSLIGNIENLVQRAAPPSM
jgi:two-component system, chemotaxis family, chemotaxis protein CheY